MGTVANGVYRNPSLTLTYKIPFGWVERTSQMREEQKKSGGRLLLAVFERPPEAMGDSVNSAVIIAAESISSYPGLKTADDYFATLTELTKFKGFKIVNEAYEVTLGTKRLVRGDFSREVGKLIMYQSSLVMLAKGYGVSFTFIGGSEDEIESLAQRLNFSATGTPSNPPKAPSH